MKKKHTTKSISRAKPKPAKQAKVEPIAPRPTPKPDVTETSGEAIGSGGDPRPQAA